MPYRFFRHHTKPDYRMVLKASDPFPAETRETNWDETRTREDDDVNPDVKAEIEQKGYSLFRINLSLNEIEDGKG